MLNAVDVETGVVEVQLQVVQLLRHLSRTTLQAGVERILEVRLDWVTGGKRQSRRHPRLLDQLGPGPGRLHPELVGRHPS